MNNLNNTQYKIVVGLDKCVVTKFEGKRVDFLQKRYFKDGRGRPILNTIQQEIILLLIHLRHFPVDCLLSVIFNIPETTIRRIRTRMLQWFYDELQHAISFGTLASRMKCATQLFYTTFTFAIDGSEQSVCGAKNPFLDTRFYSTKKGHHSVNTVVICDLNGRILWLSPSKPGSNNDNVITLNEKNNWQPHLSSNEWGFGDNGFKGLHIHGINIADPPKRGEPLYKKFSHYRIIIENVFARMKDWRCVREQIRMRLVDEHDLLTTHHYMWTVVAVFINDYC